MGNDDITSITMFTIIVIDIARGPVDACGDLLYPDLDGDGLVPDDVNGLCWASVDTSGFH